MSLVPYVEPGTQPETQETPPEVVEGEFVAEQQPVTEEFADKYPGDPQPAPLSISFIATLAGVSTAAKPVSFDIDGAAKISLETDESQTPYVVALLALKRTRLVITATVDQSTVASPATGKVKRSRKKKTEPVVEAD